MRIIVTLAVVGFAITTAAQDFQLQGLSGELAGPFCFREGETIPLGANTVRVVNIRSQQDQILDAMQAIVIPEVDFRDAEIRDVVAFLAKASTKFSADQRVINFVSQLDDQPFEFPAFDSHPDPMPDVRPITFSALDITLKDALNIVVDISGCKYKIRDGVVMIMHRSAPDGPIVIRSYDVLETAVTRLQEIGSDLRGDQTNAYDNDLKIFFLEMGVSWPRGSYIKTMPGLGKLVVGNTEENLQAFENCMAILRVQPYQLEIEIVFLACDRQQISDLGPDGVTAASLAELWTNGKAELLAAPRMLTKNGTEARIKGMTECIYPTEFKVCSNVCATNTNSTATAFMVEPRDFMTRELGSLLQATPTVSPEGNLIDVILSTEFVTPPVWEQFGGAFLDADGKAHQTNMPQPYFHNYDGRLHVMVANGQRVLVGGGIPSRDGQCLVYMLLTVRMVSTEGAPLRQ